MDVAAGQRHAWMELLIRGLWVRVPRGPLMFAQVSARCWLGRSARSIGPLCYGAVGIGPVHVGPRRSGDGTVASRERAACRYSEQASSARCVRPPWTPRQHDEPLWPVSRAVENSLLGPARQVPVRHAGPRARLDPQRSIGMTWTFTPVTLDTQIRLDRCSAPSHVDTPEPLRDDEGRWATRARPLAVVEERC